MRSFRLYAFINSAPLLFYKKNVEIQISGAAVGHTVLPRGKEVTYDTMEIKVIKRQYPRTTETSIYIYPIYNLPLYTKPINIQNTSPEGRIKYAIQYSEPGTRR